MRYLWLSLLMLLGAQLPATAQVGTGIGFPSVTIGINLPVYPQFAPVPGYPVYYAPDVNANYFFYDGMYWVYQDDNWYASSWYNGPWAMVSPMVVPVYILQVPVRYYRAAPVYFSGWQPDAAPRWGDHWGNDWQRQRGGWDRLNRNSVPAPAPLPSYQRQYSGSTYPSVEQQRAIGRENYRYQPHEPVVQQHYQQFMVPGAPPAQPGQPQQRHEQQPLSRPERDSPAPGENSPRQARPDDRRDNGDNRQDKVEQRANR